MVTPPQKKQNADRVTRCAHSIPLKLSSCLGMVFLFAVVALPISVVAMELSDLVVDSISAYPSIREQVHIFRQVEGDRDIANSGWRPSLDLDASTGTYETQSPSTAQIKREYESSRAELSLTQNIFNGFDTTYQQEQTEARIGSALYEIFDTADNIALEAVQAYLDAGHYK